MSSITPQILLRAYAATFTPDDDVSLVLKCLTLHGVTEASIRDRIDAYLAGRRVAPIVLDTRVLPAAEVNAYDVAACSRLFLAEGAYDALVSRCAR